MGSGKGYLSQHLALKYGLCVVGMDAQQIHTEGAQRRNKKVCSILGGGGGGKPGSP